MSHLTDHPERSRFEWSEDGKLAFATYQLCENLLTLSHVEAHPDLRGKGAAGRLMHALLEHARTHSLKVRPLCSYAASYIHRHPEFHSLLP